MFWPQSTLLALSPTFWVLHTPGLEGNIERFACNINVYAISVSNFVQSIFNIWLGKIKVKTLSSYLGPLDNFIGIYKVPNISIQAHSEFKANKVFFLILEWFITQKLKKNTN